MGQYENIIKKLEKFIRKYYKNELLKGVILFFATGLFYLLAIIALEFFLWLGQMARLVLFWLFIAVELGLFSRFIVFPILKLFRLSKGIGYAEAAGIIGHYFSEIDDKLLNILQLKRVGEQTNSPLIIASIDQKAKELQPIPFRMAIDFKGNLSYLKFAGIPLLIILAIWLSGKIQLFSDSYSRVINYKEAYQPPAPFSFHVLNSDLKTKEGDTYKLKIKTEGNKIPENAKIHIDGETYLLNNEGPGEFSYKFDKLQENKIFYLSANAVESEPYQLNVVNSPDIVGFKMHLSFPGYLNKTDKTITGTGDATIPEGTEVNWDLSAKHTGNIDLKLPDTTRILTKTESGFSDTLTIHKNTPYKIASSNANVQDYEKLSYQLKVVKDEYPEINVAMKKDTVSGEQLYFKGQVSDDHGLGRLQLVYYPLNETKDKKRKSVAIANTTIDDFRYAFPDTLDLEKGETYELFFRVFDNDGVNGAKSAKSDSFRYHKKTRSEKEEKHLHDQKKSITGLEDSLKNMGKTDEMAQDLQQMNKEQSKLKYNDQKKVEEFLERRRQENTMMKNYTHKMRKTMETKGGAPESEENSNKEETALSKKALKDRMERQEKRLEENEELMRELEDYKSKLDKKAMGEKLKKLAENKKSRRRDLDELLELTKRYYVRQKSQKIGSDLEKLGKQQSGLAQNDTGNTSKAQSALNDEFKGLKRRFDSLAEENKGLRNPMDLGRDKDKETSVSEDQEKARSKLKEAEKNADKENKNYKKEVREKQKSAGEKMQEMSEEMERHQRQGKMQQLKEDAAMLRQVLDNLLSFSFEQEDLMKDFKTIDGDNPAYGNKLQYQETLKKNFQFVDDSLYVLALRNPMLSDQVTEKLGDIGYNMDKALDNLSEEAIGKGRANQRYVLTFTNDLANRLDEILQHMERQLDNSGSGEGRPLPFPKSNNAEGDKGQLPDIIKEQEELNDEMGKQMRKNGKNKQDKDGNEGKKGEEERSREIYELYKKQQKLKQRLKDLDSQTGQEKKGETIQEMETIENKLLQKQFSKSTLEQMKQLEGKLFELKEAAYEQGREPQRQSRPNTKEYEAPDTESFEKAEDYFPKTEILNRHQLPLQTKYKQLVKEYFKSDD